MVKLVSFISLSDKCIIIQKHLEFLHSNIFPSSQSLPIRLGWEATIRFGVQINLVIKYFLFPHNLAVMHIMHHQYKISPLLITYALVWLCHLYYNSTLKLILTLFFHRCVGVNYPYTHSPFSRCTFPHMRQRSTCSSLLFFTVLRVRTFHVCTFFRAHPHTRTQAFF